MRTIQMMVDAETGMEFQIDMDSLRVERSPDTNEIRISAMMSGHEPSARKYLRRMLDNQMAELRRMTRKTLRDG